MNISSPIGRLLRLCVSRPRIALSISVAVFTILFFRDPPEFSDFAVYYEAGTKALQHRTVYDVIGHYQFKYSPAVALAFGIFFAPFPYLIVSIAYYLLALAAWIGLVIRAGRIYSVRFRPDAALRLPQIAALLLFFVGFYGAGLRNELKLGQINILPLGLMLLLFQGLERPSRSIASLAWLGALLSLAIDVKLYCAIALPVLLLRRDWGVILSTGLQLLAINLFGVAIWSGFDFALREQIAWFGSLFASSADLLWSQYNVSLLGAVGKLSGRPALAVALWIGAALSLAIVLVRVRKHPPLQQLPLILGAIAVLNPLSWPYWMLLTFPALLWLALSFNTFEVRVQQRFIWATPLLLALGQTQDSKFGTQSGTLIFNLVVTCCFAWFALLHPAPIAQPEPFDSGLDDVVQGGRGLDDIVGG